MTNIRKALFAGFAIGACYFGYDALSTGQVSGIMMSACMLNMALLLNRETFPA